MDTGAAVSVLDTKHMVELYDGHPPPLRPSESSAIKTVSGQPLPIHGVLCTDISIAGVTYPCEFKVLDDVTYRGVLGRDFLEATSAIISMENRTMQLKDHSPISFSEDLIAVIAPATYIIPPLSETVLPAKLKGEVLPDNIGLVEATPHLSERYQLQGAAALVKLTDSQAIPFLLINPTSKPVTLYKGATLGTFSEADGDPDVHRVGHSAQPPPPQKNPDSVPVDFKNSMLTTEQPGQLRNLLNEYQDIFALTPEELGRTGALE